MQVCDVKFKSDPVETLVFIQTRGRGLRLVIRINYLENGVLPVKRGKIPWSLESVLGSAFLPVLLVVLSFSFLPVLRVLALLPSLQQISTLNNTKSNRPPLLLSSSSTFGQYAKDAVLARGVLSLAPLLQNGEPTLLRLALLPPGTNEDSPAVSLARGDGKREERERARERERECVCVCTFEWV
jgi:hypothetical protein